MQKVHKIKLNPTVKQRKLFVQACGVKRHSYNWALAKWDEMYKAGEKPSAMALIKLQNSIKRTEMPFYLNVSKTAPQYACWDLENAFKNFFKGAGYPKFKKKGRCTDSFIAVESSNQFKQSDFKINIPRVGKVKCFENLRFEGKVNSVTVSRTANDWFASVQIDSTEMPKVSENQATLGIDVGIKTMIICSDGTTFENPKALRKAMKGLKRSQRSLTRKAKGSSNRYKQSKRISVKHQRVSNIRSNAIHQATTAIVKKGFNKIVIEDLSVKSMLKNHKLAQALSDVSFGEISRQLAYKCQWNGIELVKADRWFASSKTCSGCGNKKDVLKLSEREYNCEECGLSIDRDLNAAINLANYSPTPKAGECQASGEVTESRKVRSRSKKDEITKLSNRVETKYSTY
jgi:putative transposase